MTHRQAQTNMLPQCLRSKGHKNACLENTKRLKHRVIGLNICLAVVLSVLINLYFRQDSLLPFNSLAMSGSIGKLSLKNGQRKESQFGNKRSGMND